MSNDGITMLTNMIEWLAMPMVYGLLGLIFFLFIVKPFFMYVFDPDRVASHTVATETTAINEVAKEFDELLDGDDLTLSPSEDIPDILTDNEKIAKLAASSPDKGQALVKQWLNTDQKSSSSSSKSE